jgi:hypothetical protein
MKSKKKDAVLSILLISAGVLILFFIAKIFGKTDVEPPVDYGPEVRINFDEENIFVDEQPISTNEKSSVFLNNDIIYHENIDRYDSGNLYGQASVEEKHSKEEAEKVRVVNITRAGTYRLTGRLLNGQIKVKLDKKDANTPEGRVVLILDNAEINCDIAPAIFFQNVYECGALGAKKSNGVKGDTAIEHTYDVNRLH